MRIGAKLPNSGALPTAIGIPAMARRLEAAGFASLWVSDHVIMPETVTSTYPYASGGVMSWATEDPWYDAFVALAMAAAVTERVELGTAVLVLPQRQPVVLAKQIASLDRLAGGRFVFGVGAGWLEEEFVALATPFASRGARMEEWITLLRECWTGRPAAFHGAHYDLPAGVMCQPTPARDIPILIGGTTAPALRRARTIGDGWLGIQSAAALDPDALAAMTAPLAGRRLVLRIVDSTPRHDEVVAAVPGLIAAGITDIAIDVDWDGDLEAQAARLLAAAAAAGE